MSGEAPAGPATKLLGFVENVQKVVDTPNYLLAAATKGISDLLPSMPAARLFCDPVFQFGHSHPHPPTFGFPIPSLGPILASGAVNVLINGFPAARNGDFGIAVWCGGYFPIFEIKFGSSHVFIGGARAARMLMDFSLHCLPDFFNKGKAMKTMNKRLAKTAAKMAAREAGKQLVKGALVAGAMKGLQLAAKAEQIQISEEEVDSDAQAAADASDAAAEAQAAGVEAMMTGLQLAADAAAAAMGLLMGRDAGVGYPFGFIMKGSPNVLIGGFPMVGWSTILKGLGKILKPRLRRLQKRIPSERLRKAMCPWTGCPVEVITGRMATPVQTDFEIQGRIPIVFDRVYDTSSVDYESTLGWGWTHPYDQHLWESKKYDCLILRNEENRQVCFDKLAIGQKQFQPLERIWLERLSEFEYEVFDCRSGLSYRFGQIADEDCRTEQSALRLIKIFDRNQNQVELTHIDGLLTEIANGSGSYASLRYHNFGGRKRLVEVRQHLKNYQTISLIKYDYNSEGELISDTNRTYAACTYYYKDRLMTRRTNRDGFAFNYEYEGKGPQARCIHTWGDDGILERWLTYYPKARISTVKYGIGGETIYHYNDLDLVTRIFDAEGGVQQFEYGDQGELLQETDELLHTRTYSYDQQLNCVGVAQEDSTTRTIKYNDFCQPLIVSDEAGAQWEREYDEQGNIIATINPLGARREYEYNTFGDVVVFRDALGIETALEWTASGQIAALVRPRGGKLSYTYNERDLLSAEIDEFTGVSINYQYDDAARVKRVAELNARRETISVQRYEYDERDRLTLFVDALGHRTAYKYSGYDTLAERIDALGFKREFKYDTENRLTKIVNERGEIYSFEYDHMDRVIAETGFDQARRVYSYDKAGNLVYQRDALQRETYFRRDPMGRVIARTLNNASEVLYEYDECGRIVSGANTYNKVQIAYDAAWKVTSEEQNGSLITYDYDAEGKRTVRNWNGKDAEGSLIEYDYDEDGNLCLVRMGRREITYDHDLAGRLTNSQMANGTREHFDYDINDRLRGQKLTTGDGREIVKRGYEWDSRGNIVGIADSLRGDRFYSYDAVERLSKVDRIIAGGNIRLPNQFGGSSAGSKVSIPEEKRLWRSETPGGRLERGRTREIEEFYYDGDGNLVERKSSVRGTRRFNYGKGDKLEQQEKIQYIYDAVGNLIQKRQTDGLIISYEYDVDNQLISVSSGSGGKVEFRYDAFGRRTAKITSEGETGFLWDRDVLLSEKKNYLDAIEYVHAGFVPIAKIRNSEIETYHTDYLGTPKEVTSLSGELVWQGTYDEYGHVKEVVKKSDQNIRFQGQYEDDETGLFYNRFRYYDSDSCRYINRDPISLWGGLNLFIYPTNPTNWTDRLGLQPRPNAQGFFAKSHEYGRGSGSGRQRIPYQGSRGRDFTAANKAAGFDKTPDGYTWHHVNYNPRTGYGDMQLVKTDVHSAVSHSGGVSQFKAATGLEYDTYDAVKHVEGEGRLKGRPPKDPC